MKNGGNGASRVYFFAPVRRDASAEQGIFPCCLTLSWRSAVGVLALLHSCDPHKIGLSDYGSHSDFYPRQIKSVGRVSAYQAAVAGEGEDSGKVVGQIPGIDWLLPWYERNCPRGELTIVHGDFRIDNLVTLAFPAPRIACNLRCTDYASNIGLPPYRTSRYWGPRLGALHTGTPTRRSQQPSPAIRCSCRRA